MLLRMEALNGPIFCILLDEAFAYGGISDFRTSKIFLCR